MTGRARGRSRGRGRTGQPPPDTRRPGEDAGASRGRSRGAAPPAQAAAPPQQAQAPPPAAAPPPADAPPTQAMAQLSVSEGGRPERRPRYNQYQEIESRPQWCTDKRGTSGKQISLVSNYFKLNMKPGEK